MTKTDKLEADSGTIITKFVNSEGESKCWQIQYNGHVARVPMKLSNKISDMEIVLPKWLSNKIKEAAVRNNKQKAA